MSTNVGAIHVPLLAVEEPLGVALAVKRRPQVVPHVFTHPTPKPIEHRLPFPKLFRKIAPGDARREQPQDAADHQPMRPPRSPATGLLRRQQRLQWIPFLVRENRPHGDRRCQSIGTN